MKPDTSFEPVSKVLEFEKNKMLKPKSNNKKTQKKKKTKLKPHQKIAFTTNFFKNSVFKIL
jgi:hypothetical protein